MANIIIQVSKYLIIILMAAYTFSCFSIFTRSYEDEENKVLIRQDVLLFMIQITAFIAMYFATQDLRMMFIYGALAVIVMAVILLYNLIYPNVSRLVVNNMCMLITAGMIMITRLSAQSKSPYGIAIRQLVFVVVGIVFGLIVPVLIRKMTFLENWTYIYAAVGGAALLIVALFAATLGGAKLSFNIGPVSLQPSEFVKILFVFFVAASLNKSTEFKNVVVTTAIAAAHVLILVCDWKWRLVWNRVIPWSAGYDSSCRDGPDLLCNDRRNGTDFYTVSDPCMRQLLCDVFEYCDGIA